MRVRPILLVAAAGLLGCQGELQPPPRAKRQAARNGDAMAALVDGRASDAEAGTDRRCGRVSARGCCSGQLLMWCEDGELKQLSCANKPACGWNDVAEWYDCNTSGNMEPTGTYGKECAWQVPDGSLPRQDAGRNDGGACGAISQTGCCDGNVLKFCEDGVLRQLSCGLNPSCGWRVNAYYFDCGTEGKEDPQGKFPKACPGTVVVDSSHDLAAADQGPADQLIGRDTSSGGGDPGCSCRLGRGSAGDGLGLLLLGVGVALCRRRWSRRA